MNCPKCGSSQVMGVISANTPNSHKCTNCGWEREYPHPIRVEELEQQSAQALEDMQKGIDELRKQPALRQYVNQHKLKLIDSRLGKLDQLLDMGVLK